MLTDPTISKYYGHLAETKGKMSAVTMERCIYFARKVPQMPQDVRPHVHRQREQNILKLEESAVNYARTAAHYARLALNTLPQPARTPRQYRTIVA